MSKKQFPSDVLAQAIDVQSAWSQVDENLAFGSLNVASLTTDIAQIRSMENNISTMEAQLTELRGKREALCLGAWDKVKRARAGFKASFGDDSLQYEMVGGTPVSERKRARRAVIVPAEPEPVVE